MLNVDEHRVKLYVLCEFAYSFVRNVSVFTSQLLGVRDLLSSDYEEPCFYS
jgi:hypothetical protein